MVGRRKGEGAEPFQVQRAHAPYTAYSVCIFVSTDTDLRS
jgi:hypothetical protein